MTARATRTPAMPILRERERERETSDSRLADPQTARVSELCVAPVVQLSRPLKVRLIPKAEHARGVSPFRDRFSQFYVWRSREEGTCVVGGRSGGKRAFFLMTQGLRQHPNVELVGSAQRPNNFVENSVGV